MKEGETSYKMEKTRIQEELYNLLKSELKGKGYKQQLNLISEMEEYLQGIKNAIIADNTFILCSKCNKEYKSSEWQSEETEETYIQNINNDYNEPDEYVKFRSKMYYSICPNCKNKSLIKEAVLDKTPLSYCKYGL